MDYSRHSQYYSPRLSSQSWGARWPQPQVDTAATKSTTTRNSVLSSSKRYHKSLNSPATNRGLSSEMARKQRSAAWMPLFSFTTRVHLPILFVAIVSAVIVGALAPVQSWVMGRVFGYFAKYAAGQLAGSQFKHDMLTANMWFVGLGVISWIGTWITYTAWGLFGELQARSARERVFNALLNRNMEWFDLRKDGMGALTTKIQSFISDLQIATAQPLGLGVRDLATAIASLALAFHQDWKLTLVIISTLPLAILVVPYISSRIQPQIAAQIEYLTQAAKHTVSSFSVIETVKCYNGQGVESWRYSALLKEVEKHYFKQVSWNALQTSILKLVTLVMFVQGFWYGSSVVTREGTNAAGKVLTAFWSCIMATSAMMQIMPMFIALEKGKMAGHKLRLIMAAPSNSGNTSSHEAKKLASCAGDISFENVDFAYPARPEQPVLRGIDLFFAAGDTTFIVGTSGSGKSTIGQLLMRFYDVNNGRIMFDGVGIDTLDTTWLRMHMVLVEQTSLLFDLSLEENIKLGSCDYEAIGQADIQEAAQFSNVHDTITTMPDGYQTRVGGKGDALSGGQRQRVALARAKLRNPSVLILDEPTSALDHQNRTAVMGAIREWRKGRSTIIITHDISQIQANDFVYVMRDGQVVQSGFRKALEGVGAFQDFIEQSVSGLVKRETSSPGLDSSSEDGVSHGKYLPDEGCVLEHTQDVPSPPPLSQAYNEDPMDWYLDDELVDVRTNRWVGSMFSSHMGTDMAGNRQSVQVPQVVAPFWSIVPGNRMTSVLGLQNLLSSNNRASAIAVDSDSESTKDRKRASYRLSREVAKTSPGGAFVRPNPVVAPKRAAATDTAVLVTSKSSADGNMDLNDLDSDGTPYTIRQILATVWPNLSSWHRFALIIGFSATLVYAASTPTFAYVFSKLLNTLYTPADRSAKALKYSLTILGIAMGDAVTIYVSNTNAQYLAQCWVNELRRKALANVLEQPREFFDKEVNSVSRMAECLDQQAEVMQHLLGRFVSSILIVVVMVFMAVVWSLVSCWKITLVLLACSPVLLFITSGLSSTGAMMEKLSEDAKDDASAIFAETFTSIKTVRILTLEAHFKARFTKASELVLKIGFRKAVYVGIFYGLSQSIILFLQALIFWYGSVLLRNKSFIFNDILQALTLLLLSISTATMLLATIPQVNQSREAGSRVLRLVDLPRQSHEHEGQMQITSVGNIVLSNVRFRYPSRPECLVLNGVSFIIPSGRCVALVGTSGSGKSTIAALLLKLYQTAGAELDKSCSDITLSGRILHQIATSTLRNFISIVPQAPTLFPTSTSGNIVYGLRASDPRNSASNVRAAAELAGIHDFVSSLPSGYDTQIGDGGMGLSGGQAQRIAIARALARNPDVLILDEATSALDVASVAVIRTSVLNLLARSRQPGRKALTVIIITHAREMMEIADEVVVLDQGRVVEIGSYHALSRDRDGAFLKLVGGEVWERATRKVDRRSMTLYGRAAGVY